MEGSVFKFLIVEDDESQRMILKSILKKNYKCEIKETCNGKEALEYLRSELPSLILMDLSMPEIDGPELLKIFQTNPVLKKIPVIVISANNDRNIIASLVDKGLYDYILKPIEINATISRINKVLSKILKDVDSDILKFPSSEAHPKLLLIEPDKYQRELINIIIGNMFNIKEARNGMEALNSFEKQKCRYILLSDKVELLDKKIVTQKIREIAEDSELSIYLIYTGAKTISEKVFNFDGLIKRSTDGAQFKEEILRVMNVIDPQKSSSPEGNN